MSELPGIFHTSPGFEGSRYDVVIQDGYRGIQDLVPVTSEAGSRAEAVWNNITPIGFGEIIIAYRTLKATGEPVSEEAIARTINEDATLAQRLADLQRQGSEYTPPEDWFNGHDNQCEITLKTSDTTEYVLFHHFMSMLFQSRVGIGISTMTLEGVHEEKIDFDVRSDWAHQGTGTAALPMVKTYFPLADIDFINGYKRVPLPGHPEATPPDGFGDPKQRFISSLDLPDPDENPDAWAGSLAAQVRHFFEGPRYPELSTDPEFATLVQSIQEGVIKLQEMLTAGTFTWDAMRQAAVQWEEEHGRDMLGKRVLIYPKRATAYQEPFEYHPK
jgi:hypothetical protein